MQPFLCFLSISARVKGIPYGGGPRPDGSTNHGFRPLKGKSEDVASIPEAAADPALADLVRRINAPQTAFFSVGCVSGDVVDDPQGKRVTGYVEFGINDKKMVGDAANYFPIFFHFDQRLKSTLFPYQVKFDWELEGANFFEIGCHGFTCGVVINTGFYPTTAQAREAWMAALSILGDHLEAAVDPGFDPIF
jgi:hypothetical protein